MRINQVVISSAKEAQAIEARRWRVDQVKYVIPEPSGRAQRAQLQLFLPSFGICCLPLNLSPCALDYWILTLIMLVEFLKQWRPFGTEERT
jgi:hypothetical protein